MLGSTEATLTCKAFECSPMKNISLPSNTTVANVGYLVLLFNEIQKCAKFKNAGNSNIDWGRHQSWLLPRHMCHVTYTNESLGLAISPRLAISPGLAIVKILGLERR